MTSILDLASDIARNAAIVTDFLESHKHVQPSFDPNGPAKFPTEGAGDDVLAARTQLIYAARQLQFLALGPTESLQWFALAGALDTITLRWLYHYDVPSCVPKDGSISYANLAQKLDLSQRTLTRILRHAMTKNIFIEPSPGHIAHTNLSLQLAQPGNPIRGVVGHQTETVFPAVSRIVEAHDKFGTKDEPVNHAAFNVAFETDEKAMNWVAKDPIRSARFTESMKGNASSGPFSTRHTVDGFDWQELGNGVVVDVGGSAGQVSKAIAASAPSLGFVVQDQPAMIGKGLAELEPELRDSVSFQAHDFFESQPVDKPAAFFLRLILHDWPDHDAIRILRQLVPKMGQDTVLLINDAVIPEPGEAHPLQERYIRNVDLLMLAMFNGLERTRDDWHHLIEAADPVLKIESIAKPKGSALSLITVKKMPRT